MRSGVAPRRAPACRRRRATVLALLAALAVLALAAPTWADDIEEYRQAKASYDEGDYQRAAERFGRMLDPRRPEYLKDEKLRRTARPFHIASLIALERTAEADAAIATHLRDDPFYAPPRELFRDNVRARFDAIRTDIQPELDAIVQERERKERERAAQAQKLREAQARRIEQLERLARQETVVERRSRWLGLVPFGVGQFQNGNRALGWFFATSEAFGVAGTVASAAVALHRGMTDCRQPDPETGEPIDCAELDAGYHEAQVANFVCFGATAVLVAAGIIEAQVSYEPDVRTTRPRELPTPLKVEPKIEAKPEGALAGLVLRF
ncbi:MAG: hypothetical protein HY744_19390 [Deltaproteobacteria bacterium]|nr:hypothetical protein [Deltaproteobacteria bacterium]